MNLKDILDESKKYIDANNKLQPTSTLATNFNNPVGEANTYVQFVYASSFSTT